MWKRKNLNARSKASDASTPLLRPTAEANKAFCRAEACGHRFGVLRHIRFHFPRVKNTPQTMTTYDHRDSSDWRSMCFMSKS